MSRLGLIVGSAMFGAEPMPPGDVVVLQRHGTGDYLPPQRIDHAANIRSLAERGCERVLAICSVGSLREEIGVGSFLCPDDFVALHLGGSAFEDERGHLVAGFDPAWRSGLLEAWGRSAGEPLGDGGTYWQAIGPRFETPAEIRLIAPHAAVVGMTLASECIVACELGLPFAAICAVDNLANGIGGPLSAEEFEAGQGVNRARLEALVPSLVAELGTEAGA
jgi:5'-methylthioadenosine phosphorylase